MIAIRWLAKAEHNDFGRVEPGDIIYMADGLRHPMLIDWRPIAEACVAQGKAEWIEIPEVDDDREKVAM